jgi:hypothetical protein
MRFAGSATVLRKNLIYSSHVTRRATLLFYVSWEISRKNVAASRICLGSNFLLDVFKKIFQAVSYSYNSRRLFPVNIGGVLALSLFRGLSLSDDTLLPSFLLVDISPASLLRRVFNSANLFSLATCARSTASSCLIASSERPSVSLTDFRTPDKVPEPSGFFIARVTRFGGISQALRNMPVGRFEGFVRSQSSEAPG